MSLVLNGTDGIGVTSNVGAFALDTPKTATGTAVDFTGIPSWAKRVTVMFSGVSTNGTSGLLVQLGDSGGIENSGYQSWGLGVSTTPVTTAAISTVGFNVAGNTAADTISGQISISLLSGNTWCASGSFYFSSARGGSTGGAKTLSDVLTQVRIATTNGTDTFDAGTINITYE
jgi:hypothetical protein